MLPLVWFNWVAWQDKRPDQISSTALSWESSLKKQGALEEKSYWLFSGQKLRKYQTKMSKFFWIGNSKSESKSVYTDFKSKSSFWNGLYGERELPISQFWMSGFILIDVFTSIKDIDPIKLFSVAKTKTNLTFKP